MGGGGQAGRETDFQASWCSTPFALYRRVVQRMCSPLSDVLKMGSLGIVATHRKHYDNCLHMWYLPAQEHVFVKPIRALIAVPAATTVVAMPSAAHFRAVLPDAEALDGGILSAPDMDLDSGWGHNSFEEMCKSLEEAFTRPELGIICACCAASDPCQTCCHAVGFHVYPAIGKTRYRKGSL